MRTPLLELCGLNCSSFHGVSTCAASSGTIGLPATSSSKPTSRCTSFLKTFTHFASPYCGIGFGGGGGARIWKITLGGFPACCGGTTVIVAIPHPTITVVPPQQAGNPPNVIFQILAPPPPPKPIPQYGEAKWVKVFKNEVQREVGLDELVAGNPIVPEDAAQVETPWKLLQFNPHSSSSGVLIHQGGLGSGSHAVVRR